MEYKTTIVFARVQPSFRAAVQSLADATSRDLSTITRQALTDYLARRGWWPPRAEPAPTTQERKVLE